MELAVVGNGFLDEGLELDELEAIWSLSLSSLLTCLNEGLGVGLVLADRANSGFKWFIEFDFVFIFV